MSSLRHRARSFARWLLNPLLQGIDRRIALRLAGYDERVARAERDVASLRGYVQLVTGTILSDPKPAAREAARRESPAGDAPAVPMPIEMPAVSSGQLDFRDRLCCPACRGAVQIVAEIVTTDGRIKHGHIPCPGCGEVVGLVRDFHIDFRNRCASPAAPPAAVRVIPAVGELRIPFDDARLHLTGDWATWPGQYVYSEGPVTDSLEYRGPFTDALVLMVTHDRGGLVDFYLDGEHTGTADLYSPDWFVMPFPIVSDLVHDEHVLRIQPRGTKQAASAAAHVYVAELVLWGPRSDPSFEEPRPLNRGNPYTDVFARRIGQVPAGELILEVGGGERRRMQPGYVNLEYLRLECADVYGDISHLPFQEDTFSLVLAQAVFEHVTDPFSAAAELIRVAAPNGLIVVDAAFMQPLHAAPHHYFNMTSMGLAELFKSCSIVECDYYDGLASTVEWLLRVAGAPAVASETEFSSVIEGIRAMEAKLSHADIRPATSGWWVVARKPDRAYTASTYSGVDVAAAPFDGDGDAASSEGDVVEPSGKGSRWRRSLPEAGNAPVGLVVEQPANNALGE
jgi:SAM-dependent methyltransferase